VVEGSPAPPVPIRYEVAGPVATITLDRPAALNALDAALKAALLDGLRTAGADPAIRAVVLTGAGRAFCAGQDLRERLEPDAAPLEIELRRRYEPIISAIVELPKPVIGAINGVAAGAGAAIAFACDIRLAAVSASFVLAFGRIGLVPDSGATWHLPRLVGLGRAMELALLPDPIDAPTAERIGLVGRVVPTDALLGDARALAGRLAEGAPLAVAETKRLLRGGLEIGLSEALAREAAAQGVAGRSADHAEGIAAFLEKRPPSFGGDQGPGRRD
jgi:2-(1,2-epoxy-1,2-dihydrophenyl)acetyl-CoA isomerase